MVGQTGAHRPSVDSVRSGWIYGSICVPLTETHHSGSWSGWWTIAASKSTGGG